VHFSTGTDEHGMKIQRKAEKEGKRPQDYVDEMSAHFRDLCAALGISYDDFIRTTEPRHVRVAQEIFRLIQAKGDIYKGVYEGLYCVDCETFYTRKDLRDGKCPVHGREPECISEESYFFRMGKYRERLIEHIKSNPDFIRPEAKRNEILNRLSEPLKDLSVTRTSFTWGIPVLSDRKHIQYVWMDALINYLSTVGWPGEMSRKYWPADVHLIGKDIVWHHTVIWGSILMAAGIELPRTVFVHGFVNIGGEKMSKSGGAVVDPVGLANEYSPDALRYFLLSEIPFGEDGDFSEESLMGRNNGELADNLGNLVNRVLTFIASRHGGRVPAPKSHDALDDMLIRNMEETCRNAAALMDSLKLQEALNCIMRLSKSGNEYFQAKKPWAGNPENCLYIGASLVRGLAIMISPFIPFGAQRMWAMLGLPGDVHRQSWDSAPALEIKAGHAIGKPEPLFAKYKAGEAPAARKQERDMRVAVDGEVAAIGVKAAAAVILGVKVKRKHAGLEKLKEQAARDFAPDGKIIEGYRRIYGRLGLSGVKNPIENLAGIMSKSGRLPTINTVVDSYNVVAAKRSLSVGAHDLDRLEGNTVRFRLTDGTEEYVPLGADAPAKIGKGEYAATDGKRVICRLDVKQSEHTKITAGTRNILVYVQGNEATPDAYILEALREICSNITDFCGGTAKVLR